MVSRRTGNGTLAGLGRTALRNRTCVLIDFRLDPAVDACVERVQKRRAVDRRGRRFRGDLETRGGRERDDRDRDRGRRRDRPSRAHILFIKLSSGGSLDDYNSLIVMIFDSSLLFRF